MDRAGEEEEDTLEGEAPVTSGEGVGSEAERRELERELEVEQLGQGWEPAPVVEGDTLEADGVEGDEEAEPEEPEETYEYTEQQVRDIRAAFSVYDEVLNDTIPIGRLGSVLRSLSLNPTEAELRAAAKWLDADPIRGVVRFKVTDRPAARPSLYLSPTMAANLTTGMALLVLNANLDRTKEFLIIMGRALRDPITEQKVLEGFRGMDELRTGLVNRAVLHEVLTTAGEKLYPLEFAAFIKYADPKRKGVVKYEDFVRKMNSGKIGKKKKRKKKGKKKKKKKKKKSKAKRTAGEDTSSSRTSCGELSI